MITLGTKIYDRCSDCGKVIQLNKFMFGSFHICLTEEEIEVKRKQHIQPFVPLTDKDIDR